MWFMLLKSAAMLSIVLGVLLAVLYLVRRLYGQYSGVSDRGLIRLVATHHVAPKERIVLLDVLGEKILIGVTSQQITHLATISDGQQIDIPMDTAKPKFFSTLFQNALGKQIRGNR